jgi:hypothetical protein
VISSAGKLLTSLLEDTLPAFRRGSGRAWTVVLRTPQVYQAMQNASLIEKVNTQELKKRVLQRAEAGGSKGRPRKAGKTERKKRRRSMLKGF